MIDKLAVYRHRLEDLEEKYQSLKKRYEQFPTLKRVSEEMAEYEVLLEAAKNSKSGYCYATQSNYILPEEVGEKMFEGYQY